MTIKTRNRILWILAILSLASLVMSVALLTHGIAARRFVNIEQSIAPWNKIKKGNIIFGYRFGAVIAALFALLIYAGVTARFMFEEFEKTQSTEIVYFMMFVLAALSETVRLSVPFFGLWQAASSSVNAIGRTLIFARILAPLSLIFTATFSDARERSNTDRNIVLCLATSVAMSVFIPVNTAIIEANLAPRWGEGHIVVLCITLMLCVAVVSFFVSSRSQGINSKSPLSVLSLSVGYGILCYATSYFATFIGVAALFSGTAFYLIELHKQYLWK